MVDSALEEVGNCFLAAVGVVREPGAGRDGEVVKHEKRGEVAEFGGADCATDSSAHAFGLFNGQEDLADCARDRHVCGFVGCEKKEGWDEGEGGEKRVG